jgi:hypothetical protein
MQWHRSRVTDPTTGRPAPSPKKNPSKAVSNSPRTSPLCAPTGTPDWSTSPNAKPNRYDEIKRESEGWAGRCSLRGAGAALARAGRATDLFGRGFEETKEKYDVPRSTEPLEEIEQRRRRSPGVCV